MASRRGWFKAALGAALAGPMAAAAKVLPAAITNTPAWKSVLGRGYPVTVTDLTDLTAFEPQLLAAASYTLQHEVIFNRLVYPPATRSPVFSVAISASLNPEDVVRELDEFLAKRRAERGDA